MYEISLVPDGDFSLPMVTDAFVEYELNNKNYQQIFNRQIEHWSNINRIDI